MITESKVTEIFCIADDFCKEFEIEVARNALPSSADAPKRRRKRMMSDAEVITILICFHFNSYRNFKHYYLGCVRIHWKHLFPQTFSYNRFVEVMPRSFVALTMFPNLKDANMNLSDLKTAIHSKSCRRVDATPCSSLLKNGLTLSIREPRCCSAYIPTSGKHTGCRKSSEPYSTNVQPKTVPGLILPAGTTASQTQASSLSTQ